MSFFENYGQDFHLYHLTAAGNSGVMHLHPHWEMLVIPTCEQNRFTVNGTVYECDRPFLALFSPFCLHKLEFLDVWKPIERFVCYFGEDMINTYPQILSEYSGILEKNFILFPLTEEEAQKCKVIMEQTADYTHDGKEQKLLFMLMLSYVLNRQMINISPASSESLQISKIIQFMYENLSEKIDADTVAQKFYMSRSKLDKDFQKHTTVSFRQLLIEMRLSHAAYLLFDKTLKISDIAAMSGFDNENYFYSQFKKFTGVTPLKYQKNPLKYIRDIK